VFDSSRDDLGTGGSTYDGIASNANFPSQADLRFVAGDVIYGPNIETFDYGPKGLDAIVIDNLLNAPVHYIVNPSNAFAQVFIGAAQAPVDIEGNGSAIVQLNPLFSLPLASPGFPGWSSGNVAGFSLLDTIHADVTVRDATLRVIADIPLPPNALPPTTLPDVHVTATEMTGIAGTTIHFSSLLGLNIQLPAHAAASAFIDDTPSGATATLVTVLSGSASTFTSGPVTVSGTTGMLLLGDVNGVIDFTHVPIAAGQAVGSLFWLDGISAPQVTVGNAGSLQGIHGAIQIIGDSHTNSATVFQIDGSADPARGAVSFVSSQSSSFYSEVDSLAPEPIFFGSFFSRVHNLIVYGSAGSTYNIAAAPPTMRLFGGVGSTVNDSDPWADIVGGSNVHITMGTFFAVPGLSGPPRVTVEQDPGHPALIALSVTAAGGAQLDNAGNGLFAFSLIDPFNPSAILSQVRYRGADAVLTINSGSVVNDTGSAGTVVNGGTGEIDVYGTSGPLTINSGRVTLGQSRNMQAIRGEVDIVPGNPTLDDYADAMGRSIHVRTNSDGSTQITGMSPGTVKLIGPPSLRSAYLLGGTGGNVFQIDSVVSGGIIVIGGSSADILAGPDVATSWSITGSPGYADVFLNGNVDGRNVANLRGGAGADVFTFTSTAPLVNTVDGGGGTNTLAYSPDYLWQNAPHDFAHGIAPGIAGTFTNIQIVPTIITNPGNQVAYGGVPITPVQFSVSGGFGPFTYMASGLPPGLTLDSQTGRITGTIPQSAVDVSLFAVRVTATDGSNLVSADFQWTVLPVISLTNPGNRTSSIGDQVNLAIHASSIYSQPLTFSAQALPPGLAINSQIGSIIGTVAIGADGASSYSVVVSATDGTYTSSVAFRWTVFPASTSTSLEAVSRADPSLGLLPNAESDLNQDSTVVSADGRYVAFTSYATNLVPGDTNKHGDIFVRDRQTGTTILASVGISGQANRDSFDPSISADGRFVAFDSDSTNLVAEGGNGDNQIFVRDLQTGTTTLVSTGPNGEGNNGSLYPAISANGRFVAFTSGASNLTPEGGNGKYQIYVHDLLTGTTTLASTGPAGMADANTNHPPAINADGRYVAFSSTADNLVSGGTTQSEIYVRDLQTGTTTLVSRGANGPANADCDDVSISADGRHVAFDSNASNLVASPTNPVRNAYVSHWQTGTIELVSVDSDRHDGDNNSYDASISAFGRYVAFDSLATNLVTGDTNGKQDVFLRDLQTGITTRISVGSAGQGNGYSFFPSISSDGRFVAFQSTALNLVPGFDVQHFGYIYLDVDSAAVPDAQFSIAPLADMSKFEGASIDFPIQVVNPRNLSLSFQSIGLPPGLTLNAQTEQITGTISESASTGSPYAVHVVVSDGLIPAAVDFQWTVLPDLTLTGPANRTSTVDDQPVNLALEANSVYNRPLTFGAQGLPPGLAIDSQSGLISGVIADGAQTGSPYSVQVSANDGFHSIAATFQWTVLAGMSITGPDGQSSRVGDQIGLVVHATSVFSQSIVYSALGLPPGLAINSQSGVISGRITVGADAGSPYSVIVSATSGVHSVSAAFSWVVLPSSRSLLEAVSLADPNLGLLPDYPSYLNSDITGVSADGRYVVYYSAASNLVAGDTSLQLRAFVRDRQTGVTTLVSVGVSGPGDGDAADPSISADGRYIAFDSNSTNLVPDGTNGYQIFVRDQLTGTTTLVSTGPDGQGDGFSFSPAISANGRYLAFISTSTNLVPGGDNGNQLYEVFVRDLASGTTTLVSTGESGEANGNTFNPPSISADGRYIAFASYSTNLASGGTNGFEQIFVRDLLTNTTTLASTGHGGQANDQCQQPSISADGRHIAFESAASNLVAGVGGAYPSVFVSNWQDGTITLASVNSAGEAANFNSLNGTISASGRFVAFDSQSDNLVEGNFNSGRNVFLHDLQTGMTTEISVGPAGQGDGFSDTPLISADGRFVEFESSADNLVPGFNAQDSQIYLYANLDNVDEGAALLVSNTNDDGPGSLRHAIATANGLTGPHTVTLTLPSGPQIISPLSPLPTTTDQVTMLLDHSQNVTINGGIDGAGRVMVNAGSTLTASHIIQSTLVIGGTADNPATVTIAASDAAGHPLAAVASSTAGPSATVVLDVSNSNRESLLQTWNDAAGSPTVPQTVQPDGGTENSTSAILFASPTRADQLPAAGSSNTAAGGTSVNQNGLSQPGLLMPFWTASSARTDDGDPRWLDTVLGDMQSAAIPASLIPPLAPGQAVGSQSATAGSFDTDLAVANLTANFGTRPQPQNSTRKAIDAALADGIKFRVTIEDELLDLLADQIAITSN
jgi:hypothetical protein